MKQSLRNLRKSHQRCICGLRVSLHFTPQNFKLSCEEARELHPRATIKRVTFRDAMRTSHA